MYLLYRVLIQANKNVPSNLSQNLHNLSIILLPPQLIPLKHRKRHTQDLENNRDNKEDQAKNEREAQLVRGVLEGCIGDRSHPCLCVWFSRLAFWVWGEIWREGRTYGGA